MYASSSAEGEEGIRAAIDETNDRVRALKEEIAQLEERLSPEDIKTNADLVVLYHQLAALTNRLVELQTKENMLSAQALTHHQQVNPKDKRPSSIAWSSLFSGLSAITTYFMRTVCSADSRPCLQSSSTMRAEDETTTQSTSLRHRKTCSSQSVDLRSSASSNEHPAVDVSKQLVNNKKKN